jgi:putative transposase
VSLYNVSRQAVNKQIQHLNKQQQNRELIVRLVLDQRVIHPRMGTVKLYGLLKLSMISQNIKCGYQRFARILREEGLLVKRRKNYTITTNSHHRFHMHPNLIKDKEITGPEQVYVNDITYIKAGEDHLYLSLTTDAYSKRIMGYHLSEDMKVSSVAESIKMAIKNSKNTQGIIHHSDRGLQYCHPRYTELLESNGIEISMTTKYDPYENAVAERVNGILKNEYCIGDGYPDLQTAKTDISRVIWIYNNLRPHMSCYMLTPTQAHEQRYYRLKRWGRSNSTAKIKPSGSPVKAKTSGEKPTLTELPAGFNGCN